jgi:arginine transport system substrate-binding protein
MRIGTPEFTPPFVINTPHYVLQGFDIEFMNQICKQLGWDCQYIAIKDNNFYKALTDKQIDLALGGLVITLNNDPAFKFTLPYLPSKAGIVYLVPNNFTTINDLINKRIGAIQGTVYNTFLTEQFPLPVKTRSYPTYSELILGIKNGELDAAFINDYTALYLAHQYPGVVQALNQQIDLGYGIGIAALASNSDKIEQINKVILEFQNNGTFTKLYNYYFAFFVK